MKALLRFRKSAPTAHACASRPLVPSAPLLRFNAKDALTWTDLLSGGLLVLAQPGAGKTTALLAHPLAAWLHGGGSVVFTTFKPADAEMWERFARSRSVGAVHRVSLSDAFNPFEWELTHNTNVPGQPQRLLSIAMTPLRRRQQQSTSSDGGFFEAESERYAAQILTILRLAGVPITFRTLFQALQSLPRSPAELRSAVWRSRSPTFAALMAAGQRTDLLAADRSDLEAAAHFYLEEAPNTSSRTRGSVVATICSSLFPYIHGAVGAFLNAERSTVDLGTVIDAPGVMILDLSVQHFGAAAATVQRLLITAVEQAVLTRRMEGLVPPVCICMDEGHNFIDPEADVAYASSARDRLGCLFVCSQTIGQLRTACASGSRDPHAAVDALLGMFTTKFFGSTTDVQSLEYIQRTFADTSRARVSITSGADRSGGRDGGRKAEDNSTISRDESPDVRARDVIALRRGGPAHGYQVEAFVSAGRLWNSRRPSLLVIFPQFHLSHVG